VHGVSRLKSPKKQGDYRQTDGPKVLSQVTKVNELTRRIRFPLKALRMDVPTEKPTDRLIME